MSAHAGDLDVAELPELTFDHHSLGWWGTIAFVAIEGASLVVAIATYFYLRKNFEAWPPLPTALPDLGIPTVNTLLLLVAILTMAIVDRAARAHDPAGVRKGLWATVLLTAVILVLRAFEFDALNTRWNEDAYGSAAWAILTLHTTLLAVDFLETAVFLALFHLGPLEEKHFADAADAAFYQYFLSLGNVLVYAVVFLSPRVL